MDDRTIRLLVCSNIFRETVIAAESFEEIDFNIVSIPATICLRPTASAEIKNIAESLKEEEEKIYLIGCLPDKQLQNYKNIVQLHKSAHCLSVIINPEILHHYLRQGYYVISPGWLENYPQHIGEWGFDRDMAVQFYRESVKKILLLDTQIYPDTSVKIREFSRFIERPFEILPVGIDYLKLTLYKIAQEKLLENEVKKHQRELLHSSKAYAEYLMAFEAISDLTTMRHEEEVIHLIVELFKSLFSPEGICYTKFVEGKAYAIEKYCSHHNIDENLYSEYLNQGMNKVYAWFDDNSGFSVQVRHNNELLGIIMFHGFKFPQYKEHYIDLAANIAKICGLAAANSRTYGKLTDTIADLKRAINEIKTLSGLLPICASCKKIRDDKGYWQEVEIYVRDRSDAEFSHGICPECMVKLYPEFMNSKE